jgi:lysophospholipase L1-like esterase
MRWSLLADFQGGHVRDRWLMRPLFGSQLWAMASGQIPARGEVVSLRPDDSQVRILCIGGSSTFGAGVRNDSNTWAQRLEDLLGEDLPVDVINAGVPGGTTFDNLFFMREAFAECRPDWVVISCAYNDAACFRENPPPLLDQWEAFQSLSPAQRHLRSALLRCRLLVWMRRWMQNVTSEPLDFHRLPQLTPEHLRWALSGICDIADEQGFRVAMIPEPMWDAVATEHPWHGPWLDAVREVAAERGALLIEAGQSFEQRPSEALWATWVHPNVRGNRLMADAVAPALREAIRAQTASPEAAAQRP